MKLCIVKDSLIPVKKYGGTQRDIWAQAKEMDKMGHKVVFIVKKGSSCPFANVLYYNPGKTIEEQIPADVDMVHFHYNPKNLSYQKPYMVTIHGNGQPGEEFPENSVFVSRNHAERHNSKRYVYNGLDLDELGPVDLNAKRKHLLFLARTCRKKKNLTGSIEIAKKAKRKLAVVGGWKLSLNPNIKYYGMLGGEKKSKVIQNSDALLFPVLWHEPLGLAILESLYFGCPVFGTTYGSLPELIGNEYGFLSNSKSELAEALKNIGSYKGKKCHEYIADNFNARKMTDDYITIYEEIYSGKTLNPHKPVSQLKEKETLLEMVE